MTRYICLFTAMIMLIVSASSQPALAQGEIGSISGSVFRDLNDDGVCTDTDEPGEPGIPLQFVNRDTNATQNLTTDLDGSYTLEAAEVGTWQVTVNPGSGWRVTSQQTRQVLVSDDDPDIDGVDFCIFPLASGSPTPQQQPTAAGAPTAIGAPTPFTAATPLPGGQTVLPESGAAVAPLLLAAVLAGLFLIVAGLLLLARSRRSAD